MNTEQWLSLSREISKHTTITGTVHWEHVKFLLDNEKRKILTREFLIQKGFIEKRKDGCDPGYREYHFSVEQEKTIILNKNYNVFSDKEYFEDVQFDWPTDLKFRIFFFEDQINAYIEWTKRVTLESYRKNKYV